MYIFNVSPTLSGEFEVHFNLNYLKFCELLP